MCFIFFFKQKTAYEMRISDWSSDVCSSDLERLDPSIIIVRSAGNQYRAFHNVCRHRGAPLILQEQGTAKRFTCPYHAWTYNGDGTLIAVPDEKDFKCLDRRNRGLLPVRCEVWHGWIFINLAENANHLQEFIDLTQDLMGEFAWQEIGRG